jgi:hypothetical protein
MAINGRQINALAELIEQAEWLVNNDIPTPEEMAVYMLNHGAVVLPCKIGSKVWAITKFGGRPKATEGIVSEMLFADDMRLVVVVRNAARGEWGVKIFATREECEQAIKENKERLWNTAT